MRDEDASDQRSLQSPAGELDDLKSMLGLADAARAAARGALATAMKHFLREDDPMDGRSQRIVRKTTDQLIRTIRDLSTLDMVLHAAIVDARSGERFAKESARLALQETPGGAMVYRDAEKDPDRPQLWFCPACFGKQRLSILVTHTNRKDRCTRCGETFRTRAGKDEA